MKKIRQFMTILVGGFIIASFALSYFAGNDHIVQDIKDRLFAPSGIQAHLDVSQSTHFFAGEPVVEFYPNPVSILKRTGYICSYDETRCNPAWVAYCITLDKWDEEHKRPSGFDADTETRARITHKDYTHSGYDRGHMAPNEAISESYGRQAQLETFLMSNIVPQRPNLNQGPWRALEEDLVNKAKEADSVWVITGPIYDQHKELMPNNRVEIPDAFFKIAVAQIDGRLWSIAVIMPQDISKSARLDSCRTSIDEIEIQTGFDFLSDLDDAIEDKLEALK